MTRLGMKKHKLLAKDNLNSSTTDSPPMNILSSQVVANDQMMMDLLGDNYIIDEIRDEIGAQPLHEEISIVL